MTRSELEVTQHLDTLVLPGLLPGKAMSVGQTWKVPNAVVQALRAFEGLESRYLTAKLESVSGDEAVISVAGSARGIDLVRPGQAHRKGHLPLRPETTTRYRPGMETAGRSRSSPATAAIVSVWSSSDFWVSVTSGYHRLMRG